MRNKVKKISDQLSLNDKEIQQLITFSYNVGEGTLEKLFKASKAKTLEEFRKFCVKKIGLSYKPINQHDGTYNVDYTDILGGRKLSGSTDKEKSKIFE
ncbi:MAG: hypothetical protein LBD11_01840 [Candidatus Peribacteria bacterium]|jgi:hypothetical protein|nr:hypothetical protein [Candidatus Peribacteria bacterium]